ncbi:MAG: hypothetical protein EZS28_013650 [Streblomastix strix]|uniref:Uncharacterized protein n=1 Tax=Streblomastix strix TaxID=222440 RepID=A0A5J4W7Y7_9EUKA|nr:MAG: hypothetical protein EZS28_013650 [Streblomastix strix]
MAPLVVYISASYCVEITCRQSLIKSKPQNNTGKTKVGYFGIANIINKDLMLANDIIHYKEFPVYKLPNGQLMDYVRSFDLISDQRHVISTQYEALIQTTNGAMFDCFVD